MKAGLRAGLTRCVPGSAHCAVSCLLKAWLPVLWKADVGEAGWLPAGEKEPSRARPDAKARNRAARRMVCAQPARAARSIAATSPARDLPVPGSGHWSNVMKSGVYDRLLARRRFW